MAFLALSALLLASHALAQNNTSTIPSSTTAGGSQVANPSAFATSIDLTVDGKCQAIRTAYRHCFPSPLHQRRQHFIKTRTK